MLKLFGVHPLEKLLKTKAKTLKNQQNGITLMQAQNIIAETEGFNNWHDFKEKIKKSFYHLDKTSFEPSYIYSTIKTKPKADCFLLGFKENCLLNIWSSKKIFKKHSVNFIQEKSIYKYQGITEFIKSGNSCLIIDSDNKQIDNMEKQSGVHISCLNEAKLRTVKTNKEEFKNLLKYSYLCGNQETKNKEEFAEIKLLEQIIDSLFSENLDFTFNKEVLIKVKSNIFAVTNSNNFDFLNDMIEYFIYSDDGKELKLDGGVYYIKSPAIYDKNYYHFNLILMWYLSHCTAMGTCMGFSEVEDISLNIENANIFYFNPVFLEIYQGYKLNTLLRAFNATMHYYVSYENRYDTTDFIFSYVIPNCMTLTFERINDEKTAIEERYLFDFKVNNNYNKCMFINIENKNKVIYSPYNKL